MRLMQVPTAPLRVQVVLQLLSARDITFDFFLFVDASASAKS